MKINSTKAIVATNRKRVGEYLSLLIENKKLSKEGLARDCGISKRVVYNILQGKGYTMDSFLTFIHILKLKEIEVDSELSRLLLSTSKN